MERSMQLRGQSLHGEKLDEWGEVEQEPNMPLWHVAKEYGLQGPCF